MRTKKGATWTDETLLDEYVAGLEEDAQSTGYRYELYRVDHDHAQLVGDEECACVQYLQDHHPYRVFNADGNI